MCDAAHVRVNSTLNGTGSTFCYLGYGNPVYSVECTTQFTSYSTITYTLFNSITQNSVTAYSITDVGFYTTTQGWNLATVPTSLVNNDDFACWSYPYGQVSCASLTTGGMFSPPIPTDYATEFVLTNNYGAYINPVNGSVSYVSMSTPPPPDSFPNSFSAYRLWGGPLRVCAANDTSVTCAGSFDSLTTSETENPAGFGSAPVIDMAIHTTTNFWVNANGENGYFGVPYCSDTGALPNNCTFNYYESGLIGDYPVGITASSVAVTNQVGCMTEAGTGSLTCWGSYSGFYQSSWSTMSKLVNIAMYQGGGIGQTSVSYEVFGSNYNTFSYPYGGLPGTCLACPSEYIQQYNVCFSCSYGHELLPILDGKSVACVPCSAGWVRGSLTTSCTECGIGFQPNVDGSRCVQCLPGFYKGVADTECLPCGLGSQSTVDFSSCEPCVFPLVRTVEMTSCSRCAWGSLPQPPFSTQCFSCSSPQYLQYDAQNLFASYTDGVCVNCPAGYGVTFASCTVCPNSFIRPMFSLTCYECPVGLTHNADHTLCIPCAADTPVRQLGMQYCFSCPDGYKPSADNSRCVPITGSREANLVAVLLGALGILIIIGGLLFYRSFPSAGSRGLVAFVGIALLVVAILIYILETKQQGDPNAVKLVG